LPLGRVKVWQLRCLGLEQSSCSAQLSKTWARRALAEPGRRRGYVPVCPPLGACRKFTPRPRQSLAACRPEVGLPRYTGQNRCLGLERSSCSAKLSKTWALRALEHALRALDLRVLALGSDFAPCSGANRPPVGKLPNFNVVKAIRSARPFLVPLWGNRTGPLGCRRQPKRRGL
jgi:hypothetical protein